MFHSSTLDLDGDGYLDQREIQDACKNSGLSDSYDEIRATLKDVSTSATSKIDVEEFVEVEYWNLPFRDNTGGRSGRSTGWAGAGKPSPTRLALLSVRKKFRDV